MRRRGTLAVLVCIAGLVGGTTELGGIDLGATDFSAGAGAEGPWRATAASFVEEAFVVEDGDPIAASLVDAQVLTNVASAKNLYGLSGAGFRLAVLDSGIRRTHIDFEAKIAEEVNLTDDNDGDPSDADDGFGHGTHVAGIALANGKHRGVAHRAELVAVKVSTNHGQASPEDVGRALVWVLENHVRLGITAVNISIGQEHFVSVPDTTTNVDHIRELRRRGVAVVVAAGNDWMDHFTDGMGVPGVISETISVGAVTRFDTLTDFTERTHEDTDAVFRTDIFAPGRSIVSSGNEHDHAAYVISGTSMASPMVAGAVVLLQEHYFREHGVLPSVDQIEGWLRDGAAPIHEFGFQEGREFPRLDLLGALRQTGIAPPPGIQPRDPETPEGTFGRIAIRKMDLRSDFRTEGETRSSAKLVVELEKHGKIFHFEEVSEFAGMTVRIDVGGVIRTFTLCPDEIGHSPDASLRMRFRKKHGFRKKVGFRNDRFELTVKLREIDGAAWWSDDGLLPDVDGQVDLEIPVSVRIVGLIGFDVTRNVRYRVRKGKGRAKAPRLPI